MVYIVEKYNRVVQNDKAIEYINRLKENFDILNTKDSYYDYIKFIDENGELIYECSRFK